MADTLAGIQCPHCEFRFNTTANNGTSIHCPKPKGGCGKSIWVRRYVNESSKKPPNVFAPIPEARSIGKTVSKKTGKKTGKPAGNKALDVKRRSRDVAPSRELIPYSSPIKQRPVVPLEPVMPGTGDVVLSRPLETYGIQGVKRETSPVVLDGQIPGMITYCSAGCERESIGLFGAIGNVPRLFQGGRTFELCERHMRETAIKLAQNYRGAWLKAAVIHNNRPPINGERVASTGSPVSKIGSVTSRRAWEELNHVEPEPGSLAQTLYADVDDARIIQAGPITRFIQE